MKPNGVQRAFLTLALLLLALLSASCGTENDISGSLADFYDVKFDGVRARLYSSELSIEYWRENGEVPVRLTLRIGDKPPKAGEFDLMTLGAITGRSDDQDIPFTTSATLTLDEFTPKDGATISGTFDASFRAGGDKLSLNGKFETTLNVVDSVGGYDLEGFPPPDVDEDAPDAE